MCAIIFQYKICGVQTGKVMTEQNVVVFLINILFCNIFPLEQK